MVQQFEITLPPFSRGFHLITSRILKEIPESNPAYRHTLEGTWQGIYLCEFRDYGGRRNLVATIIS